MPETDLERYYLLSAGFLSAFICVPFFLRGSVASLVAAKGRAVTPWQFRLPGFTIKKRVPISSVQPYGRIAWGNETQRGRRSPTGDSFRLQARPPDGSGILP